MTSMYQSPSIYAHIVNGLLTFAALILVYRNYSAIVKFSVYERIVLLILLSLAIGVHVLSHLGLESVYGRNPMRIISNS